MRDARQETEALAGAAKAAREPAKEEERAEPRAAITAETQEVVRAAISKISLGWGGFTGGCGNGDGDGGRSKLLLVVGPRSDWSGFRYLA